MKQIKKVKIALYRFRDYPHEDVEEFQQYKEDDKDYTRVSEIHDYVFAILPDADTLQVAKIRAQMKEEQAKASIIQTQLQERINNLLALPNLTEKRE